MGIYNNKIREILVAEGHKDCNKIMKPLIDILKSAAKDAELPFIDTNRRLWITKFNNTFVEMNLNTISPLLDNFDCLKNEVKTSGIYRLDLREIVEFRSLIEAPKKDFEWVKVFLTSDNNLGIAVSVKSKVSTNTFSTELLFKESHGINAGLPSQYMKLGFICEEMKKLIIDNQPHVARYVIKGDELEDLNNGLIVLVKDEKLKLNIIRMMKNILYKTIKSDECIIDYMVEGDTATCIISYKSYTGSNPPIEISQIFMVYPYTEDTNN